MINIRLLFLTALAIGASLPCSAARPDPVTDGNAKHFELREDVIAQDLKTAKGEAAYFVLRKCRYELSFTDKSGDYYIGAEGCFQQENIFSDGLAHNYLGGVWIPSDARKAPRLFGIVGGTTESCRSLGSILCALSKAEYGRFKFVPGRINPDAAANIHVVISQPEPAI